MEGFFGIGIPEILLILVLALIILGPQDMVSTARKLGRWVYRAYHSPLWRQIMSTSAELRELPTKFVREAGLEDTIDDLKKTSSDVKAELKGVSSDVTAELSQARQEAGDESAGRRRPGRRRKCRRPRSTIRPQAAAQPAPAPTPNGADHPSAPPPEAAPSSSEPYHPTPPPPTPPDEFSI